MELLREEIEKVRTIDRSEVVDNIYRFENGVLALEPDHCDIKGWPPGEAERYTPHVVVAQPLSGPATNFWRNGPGRKGTVR